MKTVSIVSRCLSGFGMGQTCEAELDILPFRLMKIFFRIIIEIFGTLKFKPTFSDQ